VPKNVEQSSPLMFEIDIEGNAYACDRFNEDIARLARLLYQARRNLIEHENQAKNLTAVVDMLEFELLKRV